MTFTRHSIFSKKYVLFIFLWLLLFALYFPAAKAGFVADFTGWLEQLRFHTFREHINRTNFHGRSLYQFTQFNTWFFYKLLGVSEWGWHLLFLTIHVFNAMLLYNLISGIMQDSGIKDNREIAFAGVVLFSVSPYISETIVWESSFHFLQGLLLILLILNHVRKFITTNKRKYALYAGIVYCLSTFSLEVFYITPWLVLMLALYYRYVVTDGQKLLKQTLLLFFLPELLLFMLHLILFRLIYGSWVAHIATDVVTTTPIDGMGKPIKYLFHLLFLGRFFSEETKQIVYQVCDSIKCIIIFYSLLAVLCIIMMVRFRKMANKWKLFCLLFFWMLTALAIITPLWFGNMLLVIYDRYTYFADAFFYMLVTLLISFITIKFLKISLFIICVAINMRFTIKANRYWGKSARIIYSLLHKVPTNESRTIILLNIPQCMRGIPMIGAEKNSEFKLMHDLLIPDNTIKPTLYDAMAYNMITPDDGVHTRVLNDSTVRVVLNQWGTWWWFESKGGYDYENMDYKIHLNDGGNTGLCYEITLKKPSGNYLLLFQSGENWKTVDMNNLQFDQY